MFMTFLGLNYPRIRPLTGFIILQSENKTHKFVQLTLIHSRLVFGADRHVPLVSVNINR